MAEQQAKAKEQAKLRAAEMEAGGPVEEAKPEPKAEVEKPAPAPAPAAAPAAAAVAAMTKLSPEEEADMYGIC